MRGRKKAAVRSKGGRPSLEKAGQIKASILAIASEFFLREGYGAVSIESVARSAGISKRTFYHRFADKAELFSAVVRHLTDSIRPPDEGHLFEGNNLRDILLKLAGAILNAALSPSALAIHRLLLSEASRFPELAGIMARSTLRQEAIDRIARLLDEETEAGHITLPDTSFAAEQFLQLIMASPQRRALGLGQAMTAPEKDKWTQDCVTLFLHGSRYTP